MTGTSVSSFSFKGAANPRSDHRKLAFTQMAASKILRNDELFDVPFRVWGEDAESRDVAGLATCLETPFTIHDPIRDDQDRILQPVLPDVVHEPVNGGNERESESAAERMRGQVFDMRFGQRHGGAVKNRANGDRELVL
jgi:hypothetical protein